MYIYIIKYKIIFCFYNMIKHKIDIIFIKIINDFIIIMMKIIK